MIKIHAFKKKRKEGGEERPPNLVAKGGFQAWLPLECFKLGSFWKESNVWRLMGKHLCLMANERFQAWWPLECSKFGCLWKEK